MVGAQKIPNDLHLIMYITQYLVHGNHSLEFELNLFSMCILSAYFVARTVLDY